MSNRKRTGFQVMAGLIGMIKPLLGIMLLAVLMGCSGNLMASFLTVLGGAGIISVMGVDMGIGLGTIFGILIACAVLRGSLRYAEQACNHYIAFKLLARIRHKVFAALRKLTPAKLDGCEKGNLISIVTSDIELLEVFYAHTISPIAIAVITSVVMAIFIGMQHPAMGCFAGCCYVVVGAVIPIINGKYGREKGKRYRKAFGALNTVVLDNLYGLEEILQYDCCEQRMEMTVDKTQEMERTNWTLKKAETVQTVISDGVILAAGVVSVILSVQLVKAGSMEWQNALIAVISLMSSFGPTAALSALSNNLNQTLASGDRVLNLLEEEPIVEDIVDGMGCPVDGDIDCVDVGFAYPNAKRAVLEGFNYSFTNGKIHGILGRSGCGKSTLLKLIMRFYRVPKGVITIGGTDVEDINTTELRQKIAYVSQETFLFADTIENNIKVARADADRQAVIAAAKKASIHEFIESLPKGYDTLLAELGSDLSGGERQRIGLARAFLHDGEIICLDEPTSNIDSLNEGTILKSLEEAKKDKMIILVSHRQSTMGIADQVLPM